MSDATSSAVHAVAPRSPTDAGPETLDLFKLVKESWRLFLDRWLAYAASAAVVVIGGGLTAGILAPPLLVGFILMIARHRRGEAIGPGDLLNGMPKFAPALITGVLAALGVGLASIAFVLPGVVLAVLWGYALHFVALQDSSPVRALAHSWRLVWRHGGSVLLVLLALVGLNALGGLLVLGWLVTLPLGLLLLTLSYEALGGGSTPSPDDAASAATSPPPHTEA